MTDDSGFDYDNTTLLPHKIYNLIRSVPCLYYFALYMTFAAQRISLIPTPSLAFAAIDCILENIYDAVVSGMFCKI